MMRAAGRGDLYVHQDANWNVVGLTDLGGRVVERYAYDPYGQVSAHQETSYGDYDGDQDVDSTDRNAITGACNGSSPTGACRILDLDFDGDVDTGDQTLFDALPQGTARHPGLAYTGVGQPFAHQGLLFEPEIASYQNRARQYDPNKLRFIQRDPTSLLGLRHQKAYLPLLVNTYLSVNNNPQVFADPHGLLAIDPTRYVRNCLYTNHCVTPEFARGVSLANCAFERLTPGTCREFTASLGCGPYSGEIATLMCSSNLLDYAICATIAGWGAYVLRGSNTINVCPKLQYADPLYIASILLHEAFHTCRAWQSEDTALRGQSECEMDLFLCWMDSQN